MCVSNANDTNFKIVFELNVFFFFNIFYFYFSYFFFFNRRTFNEISYITTEPANQPTLSLIWEFSTGHMQWWKPLFAFTFDLFWKTRSIFFNGDCLWAAILMRAVLCCAVCSELSGCVFLLLVFWFVRILFFRVPLVGWRFYIFKSENSDETCSNADLFRSVSNFVSAFHWLHSWIVRQIVFLKIHTPELPNIQ